MGEFRYGGELLHAAQTRERFGTTASLELGIDIGTIDVSASLEDALSLLMREDKAVIGVRRGAIFLGVLTPNGIHRRTYWLLIFS